MFKILHHQSRTYSILIGVVLLVLAFGAAWSFAGVEEHEINILPTNVRTQAWQHGRNALEQSLSSAAIFDDFTTENSSSLRTGISHNTPPTDNDAPAAETAGAVRNEEEQNTPTQGAEEELPAPMPDVSVGAYLEERLTPPQVFAEEGEEVVDADTDTMPQEVSEPVQALPDELESEEEPLAPDGISSEPTLNEEVPVSGEHETSPGEEADEWGDSAEPTETGDSFPTDAVLEDAPSANDTPLSETEEEPKETADTAKDNKEASGDASSTDDIPEEGTLSNTPTNEVSTEEDNIVAVCEIMNTDCSLLTFGGFGIDWDLETFEVQGFDLMMSLGAKVTAEPHDEDKLYVRYYDGTKWHLANVLSLRGELSNFTNNSHFRFPLPELTSWERLDDLKVQIEYVHGGSTYAEVYVESVWVNAHYEAQVEDEFPELPQLFEALQALEDSAQPDVLVLDDHQRINFEHTDENSNETLIIKTDKKVYEGLTRSKIYFNVTNESSRSEKFHLQVHFPESRGEVTTLKQYIKNIPREYEVPLYQPFAHMCDASWRYDEELNTEVESGSGEEPLAPLDEAGAVDDELRQTEGPTDEPVDDGVQPGSEDTAEEGEEELSERDDEEAEASLFEQEGTENEATALEQDEADAPTVGATEVVEEEEVIDEPLPEPMEDVSMRSYLFALAVPYRVLAQEADPGEPIAADGTQEDSEPETVQEEGGASLEEGVFEVADTDSSPAQEEAAGTEAASSYDFVFDEPNEVVHPSGYYFCPQTDETYYCDELNEERTSCIEDSAKIGTETYMHYDNDFLDVGFTDGEQVVDIGLFARAAQLFGLRPERKDVPVGFSVKNSTADLHYIEPGQTLYFEMEVEYPLKSKGEFFIEAIGSKGAYGLLDPWWNSGWLYRIPIYLDNTANPSTLTDYQVYFEIDSALSDFWTNVQVDGRDIRFVRQVEGQDDWYTDTSFAYRTSITVQASEVSEPLSSFPVFVDLADLGDTFWTNVQDGGADIRVTADDGTTELPREVVAASSTPRTGELHFKATSIASSTDTTFYIYYGSSTASNYASTSTYGSQNVWSDYFAVWHMDEGTAADMLDSSANNNTAIQNANGTNATGMLGSALDFVDNGRYDLTTNVTDNSNRGFSYWYYKRDRGGGNYGSVFGSDNYNHGVRHLDTDEVNVRSGGAIQASTPTLTDNEWYYVSFEWDGANWSARTNGAAGSGSGTSWFGTNPQHLVGISNATNRAPDGILDEMRIGPTRSTGWRDAEYVNQATSTDFYATTTSESYVAAETAELDFWMQRYDYASTTLNAWVQVDEIDANASTTIYLYYGNIASATSSDEFAPFTYDDLEPIYYQTRDNGGSGTIEVASLIDSNIIQLDDGATSSLNRHQTASFSTFTATSVVKALGPVVAKANGLPAGDMLAPISFASTTFVNPSTRSQNSNYHMYSPFASSSVLIYDGAGASPEQGISIATSTAYTQANNTGTLGIGESTEPILFIHDNANPRDGFVAYPATTLDLYGVRANSNYVGITTSTTDFDIECSGVNSTSVSGQTRGTLYTNSTCGSSGEGAGDAVRLYNITNPIGSIAQADSDGGESTSFLPALEFSTEYFLPSDAAYVAIVCAPEWGDVSIEIRDNTDTLVSGTDVTCSPTATKPGKQWLGNNDSTTYNAGYSIVSVDSPAKPFYVYYEDMEYSGSDAGGDENNLFGTVQFRKHAGLYHPTSYSFGSQELSGEPTYTQNHYRWYENEDAQTPTDPWGPEDLDEDTAITGTEAVGDGDVIRLRLSTQVGNAAALAVDGDQFKLQYAAGETCSAGLSWSDVGALGSGTNWRGYDNATPSDGATLATTTLIASDVGATYEEANSSAALPNDVAIGETVEWDWVIENNSAPTNASYCFRMLYTNGQTLFNYSEYPQLVTNSAPNEPTTITPFDNEKTLDLTPSMTFVAIDAASDDIDYQVQIDNDFDFSSPVVDASSTSSPTSFSNVTVPSDKAPFTSSNVVRYTVQSDLTNNTTYYWRVRGVDTNGSGQAGDWSNPPSSFTTDTGLAATAWFQTEWEQFDTNTLLQNVTASTSDDVRAGGAVGEYGVASVDGTNWLTIELDRYYEDLVVVATPRYIDDDAQRSARVRAKTNSSFQLKVDNHASTTDPSGTTDVDWLVMDAGVWTIDDGGSGLQVIADTVNTDGQFGNGCTAGTPATVTFAPVFSSAPAVMHTLSSDNDTAWAASKVDSGTSGNPPTTSTADFNIMTSFAACDHTAAEDIDYIAFEPGEGTTTSGVAFRVEVGTNNFDGTPDDPTHATAFTPAFPSVPEFYISAQMGENGGNGSVSYTDLDTAVTASNYYGSVDEDGPLADRAHADEDGGVVAFLNASGTIEALYDGKMVSTPIDFDDGTIGNIWGEFSFNADQTNGTTTFQIEYRAGSSWAVIPDTALPGNEAGFITGPVDLSELPTATYNELRILVDMDYYTDTPILYDWTVTWKEIVAQPTHVAPFDNEAVATTTPQLQFYTTDPEGDDITYEVEWSTDRTFTTASSSISSSSAQFTNLTSGGDSDPFNSGDTIGFMSPTALIDGETYWWRVRGIDRTGDNTVSFWSDEESFTASTTVSVSAWHQTTQEQFENDTVSGVAASIFDDVRIQTTIGEYGTTTTTAGEWTPVTLTEAFSNPVVVASPRYAPTTDDQRYVRVRNKTSTGFELLVSNTDTQGEGTTQLLNGASTTVDWLVMEAGTWTLDDGGTGLQIIAGTQEDVAGIQSGGNYAGSPSDIITFTPNFTNPPAVLATVSSDNDSTWVWSGVDDGVDHANEPTVSQVGLHLQRGFGDSNHAAEDIDYIAMEPGHGTNNGVEFDIAAILFSASTYVDCCTAGGEAVTFGSAFSTVPQSYVVKEQSMIGGNGGWLLAEDSGSEVSTTQLWLSMDEDGPNQTSRGHTEEGASLIAFASTTGTLQRIGGALTGTIDSQAIAFSDGTGPKWGEVRWTDQEPSTSTSTYQVLYATSTTYELIPDVALPYNSVGTSVSPIDLGDIDTGTYSDILVRSNFECTALGDCPILEDWTVVWSEGIEVSGMAYEHDQTTPLSSGTLRVALNGVLQVTTGSISGGIWIIPNVNAFPDDVITVWIDDGASEDDEAVAVTKYDGTGDVDGMVLYERHLTLGSDEDPTITNNDLALFDNGQSSDEDIFHEVDGLNDLIVCIAGNNCTDSELFVLAGTTYRPDSDGSGNVSTHDIEINGTLIADSNFFFVNGSWDNNGAFAADTSSVAFNATSTTELIDSTGAATSSFYAVVLGQGSGSALWQGVTDLDVDNNFTIVHGTFAPLASTTTIGGNLTINANGGYAPGTSTTTFDGTGVSQWRDDTTPKQDMGQVEINGTSKTVRLQTDIYVTDLYIVSGSTLDVTSNDYAIDIRGDFVNTGSFTPQNGTVNFVATSTGRIVSPGPSDFFTMVFNGSGGNWSFPDANVTADGDFTVTDGIVTLPTSKLSVGGSFDSSSGQYMHNNGTVELTAMTPGESVTPGDSSFYALSFFGVGGDWSFGQNYATTSDDFTILAGTVTLPATLLYVVGDFQNEAGTFNANGGEVQFYTSGSPKTVEVSGSALNDVLFTGSGGGSGDWLNSLWAYRIPVTLQSSEVDEAVTDFPVFIDLAHLDDTFWTNVAEDGHDIRVASGDGETELAFDLAALATTTRTGELHFKADNIASTTDTTFYIYFGNDAAPTYASTSQYGSQEVWLDYVAVWHMDDGTTTSQLDSSASGNTAIYNANGDMVDAKLGSGLDFSGAGRYDLTTSITNNNDRGFSFWYYKRSQGGGSYGSLFGGGSYNDGLRHLGADPLSVRSGGTVQEATAALADDAWYYVAFEWNGSGWTGRVNETPTSGSGTSWFGTNPQHLISINNATDRAPDGIMDEMRVGPVRTAGWRDAEYRNQNTPTTFYATSSTEQLVARSFVDVNAAVGGDFVIEGGLVSLPSGTLTLGGSLDNQSGSFDNQSGTVRFDTATLGHSIDAGGSEFYNVLFANAGGGWTITGHATTTNNLTLTGASTLVVDPGVSVAVEGVFANTIPSNTTWTNATLRLLSGTSYTIGTKGLPVEVYGTLEIGPSTDIRTWNASAATYYVDSTGSLYSMDHAGADGELHLWGDYNRTSGTEYWSAATDFDGASLSGSERAVSVYVATSTTIDISNNATLEMLGTSTATTTVQTQGSLSYSLALTDANIAAQYYSITDTDTAGLQLLGTTSVTSLADGSFLLATDTGTSLSVASSTIDSNTELQVFRITFATTSAVATGSNVTLIDAPTSFWWFRDHSGAFAGEAYDNDDGDPGSIRWDDSGYIISVSGVAYAGLGTGGPSAACGAPTNLRLVVNGGTSYDTNCDGGTGAFTFSGVSFTGDVPLTLFINDGVNAGAVVTRTPTGNITGIDLYDNYTIVRHEDVDALTIAHAAAYDSDNDPDIPFTASTTAQTFTTEPETGLVVWTGDSFTPGGDVTLLSGGSGAFYDGTLYLATSSTFTAAGTQTHTVGGSWLAQSGATYVAANSTVDFTATTSDKIIEPQSDFYDITISGVGGTWRIANTMTVMNDLLLQNGTVTGTSSVTVEAGAMTGDGVVAMTGGTFTLETSGAFGGDNDWTFNNLTFGDGSVDTTTKAGSGDVSMLGTLTISGNHTLEAGAVEWKLYGSGAAFSVSGTFSAETSTTTYATTTAMTIAPVAYNNLVLAPEGSGNPVYTFAAGSPSATNVTIGDGTNPVSIDANANDPLFTVSGDFLIDTGSLYSAASANDLLIGGSYENLGSFNANGGGVVFNSADTNETVAPGDGAFHHVLFNNSGGGWTISENATSTGNFTLTAANDFTQTPGTRLVVQGIFTNSVGDLATDWTGTELALTSGTGYSINTKSDVGDSYATLELGSDTDIRMWHSTSTTYTIAPSASLYSMDHAAADGELYLWGDYVRTTGSDYWSYATDFDGIDLATTSSERPVTVRFADTATSTLSGGTLEIVGDSTASTTLTNQGSGTYALNIGGGTFNANYYAVRNTGPAGLSFTGSPTVTSLNDGDLELAVDGGNLLTIAASVITANPVKTIFRLRFATSTGVTGGFNASSTDTSATSWRFVTALGNFYGENYDGDPLGDPGMLIWNDSAADITISGNVYSDEGTTVSSVCDDATPVVRLVIEGVVDQTVSCASSDGYYEINNVFYSATDALTVFLNDTSARAANVTVEPITNISDMHLYENRVILRHEDVNPITIEQLSVYDKDEDTDIPFDADTGTPSTFVTDANTKLIVWDGKTFEPDGNVTLTSGTGNAYDGTFELKANASLVSSSTTPESYTIGGSWLTDSGASFTAEQSTVTFTATSTGFTVSPALSPFYELVFNGTGGSWTFADLDATTTDDLTLTSGTVMFGSSTLAVGGSFVNNGSMEASSTDITLSSSNIETVAFGGDSVGSLTFSGSGTFTMTDTDATSTGSVAIANGVVNLPTGVFAVENAFENSGGSFSHLGTLSLYGSLASQLLQTNDSNLYHLAVLGSGSWVFADMNATTTGTTTILSGGLTAPSNTFAVGGSFSNQSSFNANAAHLQFFATTTGHVVDVGTTTLSTVSFDGVGGGWTLIDNATSTGAWALQNGASFTIASSTTLEVQGAFTNLIGGTATDWTDAALYLNASGTSYTVNSKSAGDDTYATLLIGPNTDVRMWNSSAATTSVNASSSLYSMDHAAADGDLYIWGEYMRTSGGDYWSYATDFDGTALGGSPRQVDVRIASSSTLLFSGGTLEMVGTAAATTTVDVQSSGAYDVEVGGGTLNAAYYSFRNLASSGFVLSGTPTVTSIANGDFELAVDDGIMLSVAASVIDQNPTKLIAGMRFATSSGVATGTNIALVNSTSNYWNITSHYGNFDGEAYDDDGIDACGSIRWTDSTCLEVSQAHYRFRADDGGEGAPNNEWYDQDWEYRKRVIVSNPNASTLTDYPVRFDVSYEPDMKSDFSDLIFADETGTTSIPFYVESYITSATATVWANVPSLPASSVTNIYMYYDNTFATDAQDGDSTFISFDDFEDGDISEYSGDTSLFDASTSFNWQKTYGLGAASGETESQTTDGIYWDTATTSQGSTIEFYQQVTSGIDDEPCTLFAVQSPGSGNQNYAVCLDQYPSDQVVLAKDVTSNDASGSTIDSTSITYDSGTHWYKVRIDWLTDNSIDVTVYDDSGSSIATITSSDSDYTEGGFGFAFWYQSTGWDFFTSRPYAASEPTVTTSAAQQGGGASWTGTQDTAISQDSNTNFRVRMSVENSGPALTSQQFRLQYASKTGYGSCEAVPSVSYNDVPVISGCGTNPVCMVASPQFVNQAGTTQHLDTSSGLSFVAGHMVEDPSNQTSSLDLATSTLTEVEYAVELTDFATESTYCLRTTDGGLELDSYAKVAEVSVNGIPVVQSWSLNADENIALIEGQTTAVLATGTVSDLNGYSDILFATSTLFRTGATVWCSPDDNNCYHLSSINCPLSNCSGNQCDIECTADVEYFAEATDLGSTYEAEAWEAVLHVEDLLGNSASSTSLSVDLMTLSALSVMSGDIDYGALSVGQDTGGDNVTSFVENTGNSSIDIDLAGSDLVGSGSTIPVANQKVSTSSFTYSACAICPFLSGTSTVLELDLTKPTSTETSVTDTIYWGIYVPLNTGGVTHNGTTTFYAVPD